MKVYQNTKTGNFSLVPVWSEPAELEFPSASEWHQFYHKENGTNGDSPRNLRIKRVYGPNWGDNGAGRSYTLKMAENDFKKFS